MAGHGHGHGHHENISIDWDKVEWDKLTPEERFNMEHIRMHQKHAGHADMHASMILILIVVLIVSQVCLVQWKKWRPYSYHVCTLAGMFTNKYEGTLTIFNLRHVGHTIGVKHQESLVAVSLYLGSFLLHHFPHREESFREANARHHAKNGVQMVHADV